MEKTMLPIKVGDRVRAQYPNETLGSGTVIEVRTDRGLKHYVVAFDDGREGFFNAFYDKNRTLPTLKAR